MYARKNTPLSISLWVRECSLFPASFQIWDFIHPLILWSYCIGLHVHWDSTLLQRTQLKTTTCFVWPRWNSFPDKIHGAFTTMSARWHRTIKALKTFDNYYFLSSSEVEIDMTCPHTRRFHVMPMRLDQVLALYDTNMAQNNR